MKLQGQRVRCLGLVLALLAACANDPADPGTELRPGDSGLERTIAEEETHFFQISLAAGEVLDLTVEQRGVDVTVTVDSGDEVVEYDSPNRTHGPEEVSFVAQKTAAHRITVHAIGGRGVYRLSFEISKEAVERARRLDERGRALARARQWRASGSEESLRRAAETFAETVFEAGRFGEPYAAAMAWRELAQVRLIQGRPEAALGAYRRARQLVEDLGDGRQAVNLRNLESSLLQQLGEPKKSLDSAEQALALAQELEDTFGTAIALNNRAIARRQSGQTGAAIQDEEKAVELWEQLDLPTHLAQTLKNLGNGYLALGREEEALEALERARRLYSKTGYVIGEAAASVAIGQALARRGDTDTALGELEAAYDAQDRLGDRSGSAVTLSRQAELRAETGDFEGAEADWQKAVALHSAAKAPLRLAWTMMEREWWRLKAPASLASTVEPGRLARINEALELFEERHDLAGQAFARLVRARFLSTAGSREQLFEAVDDAEKSVELFESLRDEVNVSAYRRSLLATRYELYQTWIALLMELDKLDPGAGHQERAFDAGERSRARVLLDHLAGKPLELSELRRRLFSTPLDAKSLLLEFQLGTERSFLFVVGLEHFRAVELPDRRVLEERARALHDLLARRDRALAEARGRLVAAELGDLLLGPISSGLEGAERLKIAADGALHYVPFSALVLHGRFLIQDFEVTHVPSGSFLVHQRAFTANPSAHHTLAMIADPDYGTDGSEPESPGWSKDLIRAADDVGIESFARLPGSRREAEAALSLLPDSMSFSALGSEATRETVLSGELKDYRYIHFATHGLLNVRRPELSGLVLSSRNGAGRPQDQFLRSRDIEELELRADLVVLSACRTGLGKEERGAGLVGLPHSFFAAGARRVIVSLWQVGDDSTARLMERFYVELLKHGRRPAEALREAQLAMLTDGSPHAWAPFVLIGDSR